MKSPNSLRAEQLRHLEDLLSRSIELDPLLESSEYEVASSMGRAYCVRASKTINDICGSEAIYSTQAVEYLGWVENGYSPAYAVRHMSRLVAELHKELELGPLDSMSQLIRGEVFSDYLSMAAHLLSEGYKDAAAIIAGVTLESHLRQLSIRYSLPIYRDEKSSLLKADVLNSNLAKIVYGKFDQKQVTAWLELRNNSAHGHYELYTIEDVKRFIEWLDDFISRNPA
ncbi:MAG TPA: hypothetical protein PLD89_11920 [Promineifilum sp.]|nr:hypothetical protein [Promineifilum sp.]